MTTQPTWAEVDDDTADLLTLAESDRDEGMAATTNAADPRLVLAVDATIAELNASGGPWSANDLRDLIPVVAAPLVGARVRAASMRRPVEMVKVGTTPSTLRSTHAKEVAVWLGTTTPAIVAGVDDSLALHGIDRPVVDAVRAL